MAALRSIPLDPTPKWWLSIWDRIRIEPDSGCWLWVGGTGQRQRGGLDGRARVLDAPGQPLASAHRIICTWAHGPAPGPQYQACHVCPHGANTLCCNPVHLVWATPSENERMKHERL